MLCRVRVRVKMCYENVFLFGSKGFVRRLEIELCFTLLIPKIIEITSWRNVGKLKLNRAFLTLLGIKRRSCIIHLFCATYIYALLVLCSVTQGWYIR